MAEFYKYHQTHATYEGKKTAGLENTAHNLMGCYKVGALIH